MQLAEAGPAAARLMESLAADGEVPVEAERPFVQLAHSDISDEETDRVFGYGGISRANAPIGLPLDCEPQFVTRSVMIFSLQGLEEHLRSTYSEVVGKAERVGGFGALLDSEEIDAVEYLVAGTIELIRWCGARRAGLMIRW